MAETQILSLGLDGAAWHALDRMIEADKLPNLENLVKEGARAPLRSVHPPVTCPAWRCSTAGKNPGKVGVFWWLNLDRSTGDLYTPDSRSFDTADVWDYLSEEGYTCAVLNVPMTYPPTPINGVMVSGFGAPFESTVTGSISYPPDFQQQLFENYDWEIGLDEDAESPGPARIRDLIRTRFELLMDLLDEGYDYVHLTVFYINVLQHKYGAGPETERAWELIDDYLGRLDDDMFKVIYSDHGHTPVEYTFSVNRYLIENGHQVVSGRVRDAVIDDAYRLLTSLGVSPRVAAESGREILPEKLYDWLVSGSLTATSELTRRVVWNESRALALSQGPVYINRKVVGSDYEAFRDRLREDFERLEYAEEPVLEEVHYGEDIYRGGHVDDAPDLLLVPNDGAEIYGGATPTLFDTEVTSWTSGNHSSGIILLHGADIEPMRLGERSILDIVPTVLRVAGSRIPTDLDGTAIYEPFAAGLDHPGTRDPLEPDHTANTATDRELETHLENLGYLE